MRARGASATTRANSAKRLFLEGTSSRARSAAGAPVLTYLLTYLFTYGVNLVPLLLTGVSLHPPAPKGGPTRTSADVSVPRLAGFSLIT